jgi:hypothetical protein
VPNKKHLSLSPNMGDPSQHDTMSTKIESMVLSDGGLVTVHDVLMGIGSKSHRHPGNLSYKDAARLLQTRYSKARRNDEKLGIMQELVDVVRQRGGRFLKFDLGNKMWYEVDNWTARKKAQELLFEKPVTAVVATLNTFNNLNVLMGRGSKSNRHPGNLSYNVAARLLQTRYSKARHNDEKSSIMQELVDVVRQRGGRFLNFDVTTKQWKEVDNRTARRKANVSLNRISKKDKLTPFSQKLPSTPPPPPYMGALSQDGPLDNQDDPPDNQDDPPDNQHDPPDSQDEHDDDDVDDDDDVNDDDDVDDDDDEKLELKDMELAMAEGRRRAKTTSEGNDDDEDEERVVVEGERHESAFWRIRQETLQHRHVVPLGSHGRNPIPEDAVSRSRLVARPPVQQTVPPTLTFPQLMSMSHSPLPTLESHLPEQQPVPTTKASSSSSSSSSKPVVSKAKTTKAKTTKAKTTTTKASSSGGSSSSKPVVSKAKTTKAKTTKAKTTKAKTTKAKTTKAKPTKAKFKVSSSGGGSITNTKTFAPVMPRTNTGSSIIDEDVTVHDVLIGRGSKISRHPGNLSYRDTARLLQTRYSNARRKDEKSGIMQELVDVIQQRGGRFLNIDFTTKKWKEVDNRTALSKANRTLYLFTLPQPARLVQSVVPGGQSDGADQGQPNLAGKRQQKQGQCCICGIMTSNMCSVCRKDNHIGESTGMAYYCNIGTKGGCLHQHMCEKHKLQTI